jgi:hypothetical protein
MDGDAVVHAHLQETVRLIDHAAESIEGLLAGHNPTSDHVSADGLLFRPADEEASSLPVIGGLVSRAIG